MRCFATVAGILLATTLSGCTALPPMNHSMHWRLDCGRIQSIPLQICPDSTPDQQSCPSEMCPATQQFVTQFRHDAAAIWPLPAKIARPTVDCASYPQLRLIFNKEYRPK